MTPSAPRAARDAPHVLIVGGGGTGGALAHDLTLRGLRVTLVERGEFTSGTTGRHHGLLHSGARYAVADQASAVECIEENAILRTICPGSFEENDGLFVALTDEDLAYYDHFVRGCTECGIPIQELTTEEALRLEPLLNPATKAAVRVPDATMDAMRMPLRFFATAKHHGAELYNFMEVLDLVVQDGTVAGARVRDHVTGTEGEIHADMVVNATGPWSEAIARMAGVDVPIQPSPGVMLAVRGRLCNMVLNRMHRSGDGDIIVPQRALSVVGTSSWTVEDPDELDVPEDHIRRMWEEGSELVPAVADAEFRAAWSAARPLIGLAHADSGRELSRTFKAIDHADEGVEGFVTLTGGKATTLRGMAELGGDVICTKLGIERESETRTFVTLPHTAFYAEPERRLA
jgi:glycerol-3-phosphate dehydrogenase